MLITSFTCHDKLMLLLSLHLSLHTAYEISPGHAIQFNLYDQYNHIKNIEHHHHLQVLEKSLIVRFNYLRGITLKS